MLWLLLNVRADVVLVTDWWIAFRFEDEWRPDWFRRWSVSPCVFILSRSGSRSRVWLAPARMNARVVMNLAFVSPPTAKQRPAWLPVWERHCLPGPGQGSDLCRSVRLGHALELAGLLEKAIIKAPSPIGQWLTACIEAVKQSGSSWSEAFGRQGMFRQSRWPVVGRM